MITIYGPQFQYDCERCGYMSDVYDTKKEATDHAVTHDRDACVQHVGRLEKRGDTWYLVGRGGRELAEVTMAWIEDAQ